MDIPGRYEQSGRSHCGNNDTELNDFKIISLEGTTTTSNNQNNSTISCYNGACKHGNQNNNLINEKSVPESPWHILKTYFLLIIIVSLILWIFIYVTLTYYKLL